MTKIKRKEFEERFSDYEYVYLTVLGFTYLDEIKDKVLKLNNGKFYRMNPGVQLLEKVCGMTMHGDRVGSCTF